MDDLESRVSEMKKEIKGHSVFSTQIALLNQTVAELSKVVKGLKRKTSTNDECLLFGWTNN